MAMTKAEENAAVIANTDIVKKLARKYGTCGVDIEDLEQEGTIGLIKGIRKWDPEGGASLRSYVGRWIEAHIRRAVGTETRSGKLIVEDRTASLDAALPSSSDKGTTLHDVFPCSSFENPEEVAERGERIDMVRKAMSGFDSRDVSIIRRNVMQGATYAEIGTELGISRERVRQIKCNVLQSVQRRVSRAS